MDKDDLREMTEFCRTIFAVIIYAGRNVTVDDAYQQATPFLERLRASLKSE